MARANPMKRRIYRARADRYRMRKRMKYGRSKILQPVQYFKRTVWLPNWLSVPAGSDQFASLKFNLSQLPNHHEFTNLFDSYKINMVKVELIPQFDNANAGSSTSTNVISQNYSVLDYDDIAVPTSMDTLMQYQNLKRCPSTKVMKRLIKPRIASEIFNTGIATAYGPRRGWVDCNYDTVEMYGIKFGFTSNPQSQKYGLKATYYLAFKNVR